MRTICYMAAIGLMLLVTLGTAGCATSGKVALLDLDLRSEERMRIETQTEVRTATGAAWDLNLVERILSTAMELVKLKPGRFQLLPLEWNGEEDHRTTGPQDHKE